MTTYTDPHGVVHVISKQYSDWTCCNRRMAGTFERNSTRFPTCLWCVISRLWKPA